MDHQRAQRDGAPSFSRWAAALFLSLCGWVGPTSAGCQADLPPLCPASRLDCDEDLATGEDGCEADLTGDANCGACGVSCEGGKVCQASPQGQVCQCPNGFGCAQDGSCPCGAGLECYPSQSYGEVPVAENRLECFPPGATPARHACARPADCQPGLHCYEGICRQPCTTDSECPGTPPFRCAVFCADQCNPAHPQETAGEFTACGPGLTCVFHKDTAEPPYNGGITKCRAAGPIPEGGNCQAEACAPGLWCADNYICYAYCLPGDPCTGSCESISQSAGTQDLGICVP